jgi:hypothetical protein
MDVHAFILEYDKSKITVYGIEILTSPPTATTIPPAPTTLGAYDGFSSKSR